MYPKPDIAWMDVFVVGRGIGVSRKLLVMKICLLSENVD